MTRETTARHSQSDKDRRLVALAVLAVLALGTYVVLSPFLVSIAWAIILVLVTWPLEVQTTDKAELQNWFADNAPGTLRIAQGVVGGVFETLFKIAMCLFTAFFLYRHGEALAGQLGRVALQVGGPRYEGLLRTI